MRGQDAAKVLKKGGDRLPPPKRHVIRVGNLRATIRRQPARPGSTEHTLAFSRLCGTPRRWRRLEDGVILAGDDLVDYRKVYAEATKWCQDEYLAYQARRSRRLAYKRQS
jgi:hypothetical protein